MTNFDSRARCAARPAHHCTGVAVPHADDAAARRACSVFVAAAVAVAAWLVSAPAFAGWPLASGTTTLLGFGATYAGADGSSATHRGVDLAAEPHAEVRAPLGGRVTFVGRVPSSSGGTVLAVTLEQDGTSITLMPLASACVQKGTSVGEGDALGEVAGDGDGSTQAPHLHVGVRRGDLYVDPTSVMAAPAVPPQPSAPPVTDPVPAEQPAGEPQQPRAAAAFAAAPAVAVGALAPAAQAPVRAPAPSPAAAAGTPAAAGSHALAPAQAPVLADAAGDPHASAAGLGGLSAGVGSALSSLQAASASGVSLGTLARAVREAAARSLWAGARLLLAVLLALGALWPIWRREREKGAGELSVRPLEDDVAAVAGRW